MPDRECVRPHMQLSMTHSNSSVASHEATVRYALACALLISLYIGNHFEAVI